MTVQEAEDKKALLAKLYFLISFATFSTVMYNVKKGRLNWLETENLIPEEEKKISPGQYTKSTVPQLLMQTIFFIAFQYARMLGTENATVIRMKGLSILNTKDYSKEKFDINEHIAEEENSTMAPEGKFLQRFVS